ncbi:MAG: hypothetical protein KC543_04835 [Myxococcales bacterium]|nr:hypothetical protein [Myxococcales bacterium]
MRNPLTGQDTAVVIAERGASWVDWFDRLSARGDHVVLLVQEPDEPAGAFARRVRERFGRDDLREWPPSAAVLVSGGRVDSAVIAARSALTRTIASAMSGVGRGEMLFADSGPDRYCMLALAAAVADQVQGSGVKVTPSAEPRSVLPSAA